MSRPRKAKLNYWSEIWGPPLGTHLKRCFSDVYQLDSRRFAEIVCDVLCHYGDVATITQATRDGGVDIFLFKPNTAVAWCIVECKRYAEHRKVGIEAIDRLAGVQLALGMLAWELSNTLEAEFCIRAWEKALAAGKRPPLISNTDQSCQFTSPGY